MCIFTDAGLPNSNVLEGITDAPMPAMLSGARDVEMAVSPSQMVVLACLPSFAMQYAVCFCGAQCSGGSFSKTFALVVFGEIVSRLWGGQVWELFSRV